MAKKKSAKGRPVTRGKSLNVKLPPGMKEALDEHVKELRPKTGITAVIEMLLEAYLIEAGKWPPQAEPGATA